MIGYILNSMIVVAAGYIGWMIVVGILAGIIFIGTCLFGSGC